MFGAAGLGMEIGILYTAERKSKKMTLFYRDQTTKVLPLDLNINQQRAELATGYHSSLYG